MYISFHQDTQCGQCQSLNQYETIIRWNERIIRCVKCGHEKVTSVLSSSIRTNDSGVYDYIPSKEIF